MNFPEFRSRELELLGGRVPQLRELRELLPLSC